MTPNTKHTDERAELIKRLLDTAQVIEKSPTSALKPLIDLMREAAALLTDDAQREQSCNYPDCNCPTESPCLQGREQPAADDKAGGEVVRMQTALDAIYNESAECRAAVIKHYGINHHFYTRSKPQGELK